MIFSDRSLNQFLDQLDYPALQFDSEGAIVYSNTEGRNLCLQGRAGGPVRSLSNTNHRDQLISNIRDLFPAGLLSKVLPHLGTCTRSGNLIDDNDQVFGLGPRKIITNGKAGEILLSQRLFRAEIMNTGKPYRPLFTALFRDVTEQVRTQSELQTFRMISDHARSSIVITNPMGAITYVNAGFAELTGYSLEEVVGRKPGEILQGPDTCPQTVKRISQHLKMRESFYEEIVNYDKQGRPYWISLSVNPVIDQQGNLTHFISVQTDITDTKSINWMFPVRNVANLNHH